MTTFIWGQSSSGEGAMGKDMNVVQLGELPQVWGRLFSRSRGKSWGPRTDSNLVPTWRWKVACACSGEALSRVCSSQELWGNAVIIPITQVKHPRATHPVSHATCGPRPLAVTHPPSPLYRAKEKAQQVKSPAAMPDALNSVPGLILQKERNRVYKLWSDLHTKLWHLWHYIYIYLYMYLYLDI